MNWYKKANSSYGFYEGQELTFTPDYWNYSRTKPEYNKATVIKVNEDGTLDLIDKGQRKLARFEPRQRGDGKTANIIVNMFEEM